VWGVAFGRRAAREMTHKPVRHMSGKKIAHVGRKVNNVVDLSEFALSPAKKR